MPRRFGLPLVMICLTMVSPARGEFLASLGSTTVDAGATGVAVEVLLTNTGAEDLSIDAFSFGIDGDPGITFTGATTGTTSFAYIFAGHSLFGPNLATQLTPNLLASDFHDAPGVGRIIAAGETVGLGVVIFNVSPSATGVLTLAFSAFPATGLGFDGADIAIDNVQVGSITVRAVPEPGAGVLLLAGVVGAVVTRRVRKRGRSVTRVG